MGLFDSFRKPNPQEMKNVLNEAAAEADAYAAKGDMGNALAALLEYKELGWDKPNYVYRLGVAYHSVKKIAQAKECYKRAIELNPANGTFYINYGRTLFDDGEYEAAASSYEKAMHIIGEKPQDYQKGDDLIACAWYGASLAMSGKKEEGDSYITEAETKGHQKGNGLRRLVGLPLHTSCTESLINKTVVDQNTPDTPRMRELYQKLANLIYEAILPDDWTIAYLYGEVTPDARESYYYYRRVHANELISCFDATKKFNVSREKMIKSLHAINLCLVELHDEYAANYEKPWTNLTFVLYRRGMFNIYYHYEDVHSCGFFGPDRQIIWKYETTGVRPETDYEKTVIDRYLQSDRFMKHEVRKN